ncbi:ATP-binding protein [Spirosoma luteum]|uniref:ATP-binding protein n=1 Tax=Spirosoma luteum TaxID=431553 RepID=UPI00036E07DE|nr:ATP-binding protein [Spirosoma luteum]
MPKIITGKDILRQLKEDLIGKDSHRGVTFTYSWLANQFGHFSLGFIVTLILHAILRGFDCVHHPANGAAGGVAAFWLIFELYNFLGPLLSNRVSRSKRLFIPGREKYVFQPDWWNIGFDTATDVGFFWFGTGWAWLYADPVFGKWLIILGMFLILLIPSRYWYVAKMYLQAAGYPFQCRISQWTFAISEDDKRLVDNFLTPSPARQHLLIFGEMGNGKTGLGVGIATEYSIQHKTCFYVTGMKLYSMFPERMARSFTNIKNLWTWRQASLLVIDDINPGGQIDDLITPERFLELLDATPTNRNTLVNKDVIWVLGNEDSDKLQGKKWVDMVHEIGVARKDIYTIHLPPKEVRSK